MKKPAKPFYIEMLTVALIKLTF